MEDPLWNQARAFTSDLSAGRYKFRGVEVRYVKAKEFLKRIDPLQKEAERVLVQFGVEYYQGENPQGFTKVREYRHENNSFDIVNDPLAAGSVVVVRSFRRDPDSLGPEVQDGHPDIYWVAPQKWPGKNVPFVYQFCPRWSIDDKTGKMVTTNLRINCLDWNDPIMEGEIEDIFNCAWAEVEVDGVLVRYGRSEIDVWHKGNTRPERRRDPVQVKTPPLVLRPFPSGV